MLATDTSIWITESVFPNTWENQAIPKQEEVFHEEEKHKDRVCNAGSQKISLDHKGQWLISWIK